MENIVLLTTNFSEFPCKKGKVRDIYDLGKELVLITTDRISAFDWVLPNGIPDKGFYLTQISAYWFRKFRRNIQNHLITTDINNMPEPFSSDKRLEGRTMLVSKLRVLPVECVVRGFLSGSAYEEYQKTCQVCGNELPRGLLESAPLLTPIFTPATKVDTGHDININSKQMVEHLGNTGWFKNRAALMDTARMLEVNSFRLFDQASVQLWDKGLILADTKFEWGLDDNGELVLVDEVLTPDSSRFWHVSDYCVGKSPPSFDKQFVRDWLKQTDWDRNSPPPELPKEIIQGTATRYRHVAEMILECR